MSHVEHNAHTTEPRLSPQQQWLDHMKAHLIQNLSIGPADFDAISICRDRGGWSPADHVFDRRFTVIVKELNANLAA